MSQHHPMTPLDAALVLGATMRLTRLVVEDDLGAWFIRAPIIGAIQRHSEHGTVKRNYLTSYAEGLTCPHCVGFWIGAGVLGVTVAAKGTRAERPWRFLMAALALNTVSVVAGKAVDYWG